MDVGYLEFIPSSHQYLLTVLSIWWAFGQLIGSLVSEIFVQSQSVVHKLYPDRMAFDSKFLLFRYDSRDMPALRKPRVEILHVHHGRSHAPPLGSPFLGFPSLRVSEVPDGPGS